MKIPQKVFWIFTAILCVLLITWLGGSLYLRLKAPEFIFQTQQSKKEEFKAPSFITFGRDYLINRGNEKIEILIVRNYQNYKSDEAILYFHGTHGRLPQILENASRIATVFSPAYPGYSRSQGEPSEENIYETVNLAMDFLIFRCKYKENQIIILGHSLGASPALYAAARYPDLKKVAIVNAFYSMQTMCQTRYSILCVFTGDIFNTAKLAPLARAKVRQFHVLRDAYVPFEQGQKLFGKIGSKDKKFESINGTHDDFDVAEILKKE